MVVHFLGKEEAAGSSPVVSSRFASVAQWWCKPFVRARLGVRVLSLAPDLFLGRSTVGLAAVNRRMLVRFQPEEPISGGTYGRLSQR